MDVRCEKCATEYELDETKLKSSGVTVKCTNCGHMFKVRKRAAKEEGAAGGKLRTWLVRMTDGEIKACYELSTLQQWIAAGHVTRECQISRTGKKWKRLGDIAELSSFFEIAEDAKREAKERRLETAADAGKRGVASPHTLKREASQSRPLPKPVTGTHGVGGDVPKKTMMGQPALVPPRTTAERNATEKLPGHDDETRPVPTIDESDFEESETKTNVKPAAARADSEDGPTKSFDGPAVTKDRADSIADDGPTKKFAPDAESPFDEDVPTTTFAPDSKYKDAVRDSKKTVAARKISKPPEAPVKDEDEAESGDAKTGEWAAGARKAAVRAAAADEGPSFANLGKSAKASGDAAFVGGSGKVGPIDEEFDDYQPRGGGAGKWVALGSVLVLAAAGVILYLTVFSDKGKGEKQQATNTVIDAGSAGAPATADAAGEAPPPDKPKANDREDAKTALLHDSSAGLELAKESLTALPEKGLDQRILLARVHLALAQHAADAPATSKKESIARTKKVRRLAADGASILAKVRKEEPNSVPAMIATADTLRLQKRPTREVERWLRKALTKEKGNRDALYVRALLHIRDKRHQDARKILKELVDDSVPDTRPRYRLAILDFGDESYDAAKSGAESVLQVAKEHAGAQELLQRVAKAQAVATTDAMPPQTDGPGPTAPAGESYASLLKKANKTAEVGNCRTAIELFRKALDKNPSGVAALTGLGYCHADRKEFAQAQGKFRAALGISPRYQGALYGVAEAYQQQGLKSKAIAAYTKYLSVHPSGSRAASAKRQIARLGGGSGASKPPTDKPPTDKPPTDKPPTDKPPTDKPPTDKPPTDKPPTDKPPTDKPPADKPPTDKPPADKPPADKPPTDKPPADKPPADKPPADKPPADKPPADKPPVEPTPEPAPSE